MRLQLSLFVLLSVTFVAAKAECPVTCIIYGQRPMVDFKCERKSGMQVTVMADVSMEIQDGKPVSIKGTVENKYPSSGNTYRSVFTTKCSKSNTGSCMTAKVSGPTIKGSKIVKCKGIVDKESSFPY